MQAVVGEQVLFDELITRLAQAGRREAKGRPDAGIAPEAETAPVGSQSEQKVQLGGGRAETTQEAIGEQTAGEPAEGLLQGPDTVAT